MYPSKNKLFFCIYCIYPHRQFFYMAENQRNTTSSTIPHLPCHASERARYSKNGLKISSPRPQKACKRPFSPVFSLQATRAQRRELQYSDPTWRESCGIMGKTNKKSIKTSRSEGGSVAAKLRPCLRQMHFKFRLKVPTVSQPWPRGARHDSAAIRAT